MQNDDDDILAECKKHKRKYNPAYEDCFECWLEREKYEREKERTCR